MSTPRTTRSRTALSRASPRNINILQPIQKTNQREEQHILNPIRSNTNVAIESVNDETTYSRGISHSKPHIAVTPAKRMRITHNDSINRSNDRPLIAQSGHATLSLYSFLPDSVVELCAQYPQSESCARVDVSGYGLFASTNSLIVWKISETNESHAIQKHMSINDDCNNIMDRVCLIENSDDMPSVMYITRSGAVYFSAWNDQLSSLSQVSNMRDDHITCITPIRDTIFLIGTAQGRLIAMFVDGDTIHQSLPRVSLVDVTKKANGMLSGLVSVTGRMLRWSTASTQSYHQSDKPVLAIIPYFVDGEDFGAYVLHQDILAQWRVMGSERILLWSTAFNCVFDGQREVRAVSMASTKSNLAVLFSVQNEMAEFFRVAMFDVASDSTPPIDQYSRIISLSSRTNYPSHIALSDGDVPTLFVWSKQDIWVSHLSASADDDDVSAYSFNATAIQGGGLICKFNHEIRALPSYRQAECLIVTTETGLIDVRYSVNGNESDVMTSTVNTISLDSVAPVDLLKTSLFFYQRDQLSASRLKLESARLIPSMPSLDSQSPALDSALLTLARQLMEAPVKHVNENNSLQTKIDNYESFLGFLHAHQLDSILSPNAHSTVLMFGEFAAIALSLLSLLQSTERALEKSTTDRKIAEQRQKMLYSVMEHCVQQSSKSFNPDQFFTHLTKLSNIFAGCLATEQKCQPVNQASSAKQQDDCCYSLQAINSILDVIFTESARYHETHASLNNRTPQHSVRWTVSTEARSCVKSHCELLASTLFHIKTLPSSFNSIRIDLFAAYLRLARLFLLELHDHIRMCPQDAQSITQFTSLRSLFVKDLRRLLPVDLGSHIDVVIEFAAEFHDYESLISITTAAPTQKHDDHTQQLVYLNSCVHRFGQQFAQVLFRVAIEQQHPSLLFSLPSPPAEYSAWLAQFLSDNPELSWIVDIDEQRFTHASSTLFDFAQINNAVELGMTWSQQKVMFSISKLCLLCDEHDSLNRDKMRCLDEALDVCDAQTIASQGVDSSLLSPEQLINRLLELAVAPSDPNAYYSTEKERIETDTEPFLQAFDVFHKALFPLRLTSNEEDFQKYQVLSAIWSAVVQVDYPKLVDSIKEMNSGRSLDQMQLPAGLEDTKLWAVWSYLRGVDHYNRRPEFDSTFQMFLDKAMWLNEGDESVMDQLKTVMKTIQKRACQT